MNSNSPWTYSQGRQRRLCWLENTVIAVALCFLFALFAFVWSNVMRPFPLPADEEGSTEVSKETGDENANRPLTHSEEALLRRKLDQVADPKSSDRADAARRVGLFGPRARQALPILRDALDRARNANDSYLFIHLAYAITSIDANDDKALDLLLQSMRNEPNYRLDIVLLLSNRRFADRASRIIPALIDALQDRDEESRYFTICAMEHYGFKAQSAIPTLCKHLRQDESVRVRQRAALCLLYMGPSAQSAVPFLIEAVEKDAGDEEHSVAATAARALGEIGPSAAAAVDVLAKLLPSNKDLDMRIEAALSLAKIGPAAAPAIPRLISALADEDERVRRFATDALGNIGPPAVDAIPALTKSLRDRHTWVADGAGEALRKIKGR